MSIVSEPPARQGRLIVESLWREAVPTQVSPLMGSTPDAPYACLELLEEVYSEAFRRCRRPVGS